jgi:hypothetical protein
VPFFFRLSFNSDPVCSPPSHIFYFLKPPVDGNKLGEETTEDFSFLGFFLDFERALLDFFFG